jgi:hypothetical protein
MQVTTLNKIINLFLVGTSFNVILIGFIAYSFNGSFSVSDYARLKIAIGTIGEPTIVVVVTFVFLSSGFMFGIIADSISSVGIFLLDKAIEIESLRRRVLFCQGSYEQYSHLSDKFEKLLKDTEKYKILKPEKIVRKSYASGIFFDTANKENVEWLVQHYSIFLLSMNYILIVPFALFIATVFPTTLFWTIIFWIVILAFLYSLIYQAAHKYLYAYEVIYRHGVIVISKELAIEGEKKNADTQTWLLSLQPDRRK